MNITLNDIIAVKDKTSFTKDEKKIINVLSTNKDVLPVGSFMYKDFKFPGDIDLRETVIGCCTDDEAIQQLVDKIQLIAKKIDSDPDIYFSDFKAGIYNGEKLRWSLRELLEGYKILPDGEHLKLKDAIKHNTGVKIDAYMKIGDRFIEASNYMILMKKDKQGNLVFLNLDVNNYISDIMEQLINYLSPDHFNPLKAAKRMWSLAKQFNDVEMLNKINPLLSSGIALLGQIKSDIQSIVDMYEKVIPLPYDKIYEELDGFKHKMSTINDISFDVVGLNSIIDNILNNKLNSDNFYTAILELLAKITAIINKECYKYMETHKILPPPPNYINPSSAALDSSIGGLFIKDGKKRYKLYSKLYV